MNLVNPMAPSAGDHFSRYEFKYLLNAHQRERIESEVQQFMDFDGYAHGDLDNSYYVRSLYFDDPSCSHYYEKIDGVRSRTKFRIRTYAKGSGEDAPVYLEQKGRVIERTFKKRMRLEAEKLALFEDPLEHLGLLDAFPENPLVEQFVFESLRRRLMPRVLVDYIRRPYVSLYDLNFRVTFDSRLESTRTSSLFPLPKNSHWIRSVAGYTILEVKFHRKIPAWFHRIIQTNDMRRLSISKFCKGMEDCAVAIDLS